MFKLLRYLIGAAIVCAALAPLIIIMEVSMYLLQPELMDDIIGIGILSKKYFIFTK